MGWAFQTEGVVVGRTAYAETRPAPSDPDNKTEKRKRLRVSIEYRGLTYEGAKALVDQGSEVYENGTVDWDMQPIGAGGWTVVWNADLSISEWTTADGLVLVTPD